MDTAASSPLLQAPCFRFAPGSGDGEKQAPAAALHGPAFSLPFKLLATGIVTSVGLWLLQSWMAQRMGQQQETLAWFGSAWAVMLWTLWHIWRSQTWLSAECIRQTWVWEKRLEMRDLIYAKLIRIPGLDWLIAPRLYVRTMHGKFAVFYAADALVLRDMTRLVAELERFRQDLLQAG